MHSRACQENTLFLSQAKDILEGKKLLEEDRRALQNAATPGNTTKVWRIWHA